MRPRFAGAALVLCLALVSTACSKSLDTDGLETQLESQLATQLETTGITVACPDDIKAESGDTFDCTATLSTGDTLTLNVTQTDGDGNVSWALIGGETPSPST